MDAIPDEQLLQEIREKETEAGVWTRQLIRDTAHSASVFAVKPDAMMTEQRIAAAKKLVEEKVNQTRKKIQDIESDIVRLKSELRRRVAAKTTSEIDAAALARRRLTATARDQKPSVPAPRLEAKRTMTGRRWVPFPRGGRRRVTRRRRAYRQ